MYGCHTVNHICAMVYGMRKKKPLTSLIYIQVKVYICEVVLKLILYARIPLQPDIRRRASVQNTSPHRPYLPQLYDKY